MKALVVFDSNFGNTKLVAEAIGRSLGDQTPVIPVTAMTAEHLRGVTLLVVGSPINGWRPSEKTGHWLSQLKPNQLRNVSVATFDTRVSLIIHGDAAKQISKHLLDAGATLAAQPTWFFVEGKEGPLRPGELARAKAWAKTLMSG
ncbi:MAG: flavodoxin family protein [Candidatus Kerfeldbacteria bacterium]|nr:flavodoxin family protein [Candidatus Kerfeldbacteria bacterium]